MRGWVSLASPHSLRNQIDDVLLNIDLKQIDSPIVRIAVVPITEHQLLQVFAEWATLWLPFPSTTTWPWLWSNLGLVVVRILVIVVNYLHLLHYVSQNYIL